MCCESLAMDSSRKRAGSCIVFNERLFVGSMDINLEFLNVVDIIEGNVGWGLRLAFVHFNDVKGIIAYKKHKVSLKFKDRI